MKTKANDEGHPLVLRLLGLPQSFGIPVAVVLICVETLLDSNPAGKNKASSSKYLQCFAIQCLNVESIVDC